MLIDYDKLQIGDKLWSIQLGDCTVIDLEKEYVTIKSGEIEATYNKSGFYTSEDKNPSLFTKNPIFPRLVEVSMDRKEWIKAWLVADLSETTYCPYSFITSETTTLNSFKVLAVTKNYRYCREIKERELTLEEIADKFGIPVENLKIKK